MSNSFMVPNYSSFWGCINVFGVPPFIQYVRKKQQQQQISRVALLHRVIRVEPERAR